MLNSLISDLSLRKYSFSEQKSIAECCSIKSGGVACIYATPSSAEEYTSIIKYLSERGVPFRVVGALTNTFLATDVYDGVVVSTRRLNDVCVDGESVTALCGASLASVMSLAAAQDLGGAESLWLVPGTVGGAVRGNAGAHGVETSDVVGRVVLFSKSGKLIHLDASDMCFTYRGSLLKNESDLYLLSAEFHLSRKTHSDIIERRKKYLELRRASQPISARSLGCVFKRHRGIGAGYFIDRAGLKGFRVGDAVVSSKHAGFILNDGSATWRDILSLISSVENVVFDRFGIVLEREIEVIS